MMFRQVLEVPASIRFWVDRPSFCVRPFLFAFSRSPSEAPRLGCVLQTKKLKRQEEKELRFKNFFQNLSGLGFVDMSISD